MLPSALATQFGMALFRKTGKTTAKVIVDDYNTARTRPTDIDITDPEMHRHIGDISKEHFIEAMQQTPKGEYFATGDHAGFIKEMGPYLEEYDEDRTLRAALDYTNPITLTNAVGKLVASDRAAYSTMLSNAMHGMDQAIPALARLKIANGIKKNHPAHPATWLYCKASHWWRKATQP